MSQLMVGGRCWEPVDAVCHSPAVLLIPRRLIQMDHLFESWLDHSNVMRVPYALETGDSLVRLLWWAQYHHRTLARLQVLLDTRCNQDSTPTEEFRSSFSARTVSQSSIMSYVALHGVECANLALNVGHGMMASTSE